MSYNPSANFAILESQKKLLTLHLMKKTILSILLSVTLIFAIHSIVSVTEYAIDNGLGTYSNVAELDAIESLPMAEYAISATGCFHIMALCNNNPPRIKREFNTFLTTKYICYGSYYNWIDTTSGGL